LQFGLLPLLGLMTALSVALGIWVQRAERQRRAVAAIEALGGAVIYKDDAENLIRAPAWLENLLGEDYFRPVVQVHFYKGQDTAQGLVHVGRLTGLRMLHLDSTLVKDGELLLLQGMTDLQELRLNYTGISDAGLAHLKGLTRLQCLSLFGCKVTDEGLRHLAGMRELCSLNLNWTKVTGTGLIHLNRSSLERLYLYRTPLTDESFDAVRGLTGLQELNLAVTRIGDAGLAKLRGLTRLQELNVSCTNVTDSGLAHLEGMTTLQTLDVSLTFVTDDGVADFRAALPRCYVQTPPQY
jgi:Leucine-rich repeat (LRR) protein